MKIKATKLLQLSFFWMIFFFVFTAGANILAQGVNILNTNGSFENSDIDTVAGLDIEGWVIEVAASADATFEIVDDTAQHGEKSLKVVVDTIGANQWDIQVVADSIPVEPGATYVYSIWAMAESSGGVVNLTMGNYAFNEYGAIRPANLTTEWQRYTMSFTVTDNQTVIRGPIHFSIAGNVGNAIYLDNLEIYNVEDTLSDLKPVIVEAESGDIGSDFSVLQDDTIDYVSIQTPLINAGNPGSRARIISYEVTFPDTGTYDLFARVRVGASTFDDDSFFYGSGFGEKDSINDDDWILINGLAAAGFSESTEIVFEAGGLGSELWKWVNISRNGYQGEAPDSFVVEEGELTQIFQIGAREDGLDIDKFAFGKSYLYYTVGNLDNEEPGSTELPGDIWEGPPLASNQPKFVGNVHSSAQIENFEAYWNQVTPENAGKWGSVEGTRDNMNWGGLDAAYNLAKDNGFPFHFHVLIWGAQQPGWINDLTPEEQLEEITEWFEAVAERYPDIEYLEVVNEPLPGHNPPDGGGTRANYKEALGGDGETGWDWILNAFRMAREIFPEDTRLMLNDYSIINSSNSTATYLNIIRLLQAEDLIDIIGEQGHAFTTTAAVATMRRNLDSLASTGVPIQITELDIDGSTDDIQLQSYQRIFPALYEHHGVEGITLWGWRRGLWRDDQGAYIINQNGSERPALVWLREYLDSVNVDPVSVDDMAEVPNVYQLYNNYPNPFNPSTKIMYNIVETSEVTLRVYDVLGRNVETLVNTVQSPGLYTVTFNAKNLSSGIYFYRIEAGSFVDVKPMMLVK